MTFEELKSKVDKAKIESAKAEVRINQIKESFKSEFGTDDVEEVKVKIAELEVDLEKARNDYKSMMEKAEQELNSLGI